MPRILNPSQITIGGGSQEEQDTRSLASHIADAAASHPAVNISIVNTAEYSQNNVQAALDDLAALKPEEPSSLGEGLFIPDWGILKKADSSLVSRGLVTSSNPASEIYPYYYEAPNAEPDVINSVSGQDPVSDPFFNVSDVGYQGGGEGTTFAGGFTRSASITMTHRVTGPHGGAAVPCIVSGMIYPADRGVLALLYFGPNEGPTPCTTSVDILRRVKAAVLLGNGLQSGNDGSVGGIFSIGSGSSFPSRASGQRDLSELHLANTGAGQVRLGTDPAAGVTPFGTGIPILGGTTIARGGGNDNNFLAYRLPMLADYSAATGLKYTDTLEKSRFFAVPPVSAGGTLTFAGNYGSLGFEKDYWQYQIARYRHQFFLPTPAGPSSYEDAGSYVLVHFRAESYFESLVRDGAILTGEGFTYGSYPVTWADLSDVTNVAASATELAESYHIVRSNIYQDATSLSDIVGIDSTNWSFTVGAQDNVHIISGVKYFLPRRIDLASADPSTHSFLISGDITTKDSGSTGAGEVSYWQGAYRTFFGDATGLSPFSVDEAHVGNMNPLIITTGSVSNTALSNVSLVANSTGFSIPRRIELAYTDIAATSVVPIDDPQPTDQAFYNFNNAEIDGDTTDPVFCGNVKLRYFFRKPSDHATAAASIDGGEFQFSTSDSIMFYSGIWTTDNNPVFGNFKQALGLGAPYDSLYTTSKDAEERFLDEVYRYPATFTSGASTVPLAEEQNLAGPGLPNVTGGIDLYVRPKDSAVWTTIGWLDQDMHVSSLIGSSELEVAGWPDRNPLVTFGVKYPMPSTGILIYPQYNYTSGFRPSFADGDLNLTNQFNYSLCVGSRDYVRALDLSLNRTVDIEGKTIAKLKIYGITMNDIAFTNPSREVTVSVKVPGLSTWMDVGRDFFDGPSKQDIALDGAGCAIFDAEYLNGNDIETGYPFCQVKFDTGIEAPFFVNTERKVPLLVKVTFADSVAARAINGTQGGPTGNPANVRAIHKISVVA